jgi:hypothetical protein
MPLGYDRAWFQSRITKRWLIRERGEHGEFVEKKLRHLVASPKSGCRLRAGSEIGFCTRSTVKGIPVAVVTGAGLGIGAALQQRLTSAGYAWRCWLAAGARVSRWSAELTVPSAPLATLDHRILWHEFWDNHDSARRSRWASSRHALDEIKVTSPTSAKVKIRGPG